MQSENERAEDMPAITEIDSETLKKIDAALENWDSVDPEVRASLDGVFRDSDQAVERLIQAVSASERLSEDDLAIRINTRD